MSVAMSAEDREAFLAGTHVAVLAVHDPRPGRAPLLVPVWYSYEPGGDVVVQVGRDSVKAGFIRQAGRFGICVQDETPPFRYVSVQGPVVGVQDPLDRAIRRAAAHRYLGPEGAEEFLAASEEAHLADDVMVRMRPRLWSTADFAKAAGDAG